MIFENIEFHNVEEMIRCDKGYQMLRLPSYVREQINPTARDEVSRFSTGVEIRFRLKGNSVNIILSVDENAEAQVAYIYYGSFQGGWQYSSKTIQNETMITIPKCNNLYLLKEITGSKSLPFDPELVRIVLPYGTCYYVGVEGEVEPPLKSQLPKKTYLAYGSSITHGSLSLAAPYTYPFRISQMLGCDYYNLGFAGSAHMEKAMAEYIVSRPDWDFASVEMGVNMLKPEFTLELFEERVRVFVDILADDSRPIFATSIFGFNGPEQEKAQKYREIVRKYSSNKLIFTDGLELLNNPAYISADLVHPSLEGMAGISERWSWLMKQYLLAEGEIT
ncbi:MAG: SGNH/GDSL hydrolase family protein [Clostridiales bacterium]|jgi:hypothetical protein|nr:SGNH/GDSL hydrolase family protein [Clostridiales bacterium]